MSRDKDGKFKGISVPKAIRSWVPCECELDNGECDCFRATEVPPEEKPESAESKGDSGDGGDPTRASSHAKISWVWPEDPESWHVWTSAYGERVEFEAIPLGLNDEGDEVFSHRRDGILDLPPEKPKKTECDFCKDKPVANGWGWHTGRILEPLPCPRCGQLRCWEDDGGK